MLAVLRVLAIIVLSAFALALILIVILLLLRFKFYLKAQVDGLDVLFKVGIGVRKSKPLEWVIKLTHIDDGWKFSITGPFEEKIKKLLDEGKQQQPQAEKSVEEEPQLEKPESGIVQKIMGMVADVIHLEKYVFYGSIGFENDAMITAMACGTVTMFAGALSGILVSQFKKQCKIIINIMPSFNQNKFCLGLDLVLSFKALDAIVSLFKKRVAFRRKK